MQQKNMVYEPCRQDLLEQDVITASSGPDGAEKELQKLDNNSVEDEDDICLDNAGEDDNLTSNKLDQDNENNKNSKCYKSSCGGDSVAGKNDN